jgi:hypothetical protein
VRRVLAASRAERQGAWRAQHWFTALPAAHSISLLPPFTDPPAHTRIARALPVPSPRTSRRSGPILRCQGTRGMSRTCSACMAQAAAPRLARGIHARMGDSGRERAPFPPPLAKMGPYGRPHETSGMHWSWIAAYLPPAFKFVTRPGR